VRQCSKDNASRNSIWRRWLWQQAKRRRDKRRPEVERRETLCARLRASQNEPRRRTAQNADIHVVRACVVEMHVKISQEPLDTEIYRENAAPQDESRTQTNTSCEPAQSKRSQDFTRATLYGRLQEKCCGPKPRRRLCASLCSRNACQDFTRATFC